MKEYKYTFADHQVWMYFGEKGDTKKIGEVKVAIDDDPFDKLKKVSNHNVEVITPKDYLYLPLYAYGSGKVNKSSGLNAWNAAPKQKGSNTKRPKYEVYLPIPVDLWKIHSARYWFDKDVDMCNYNAYKDKTGKSSYKFTDEIENSSYTWRVFYMSRKSKYSAEQKLAILNELTRSNISEVAKKYAVGKKTIRTWGYLYEYQGIDGFSRIYLTINHRYSKEFKLSLVQQYQKSDESLEIFAIKHGLKSKTQLSDWIMQYNESKLKAYTPRKRDSRSGRKTTFEERLSIIEELIKHDVNYNWARKI